MYVSCEKCSGKYNIPDEKLPIGKSVGFTCPNCKNKMSIRRSEENSDDGDLDLSLDDDGYDTPSKPVATPSVTKKDSPSISFDESDSLKPSISFAEDESIYDSGDKPFDFVEEEYETAIICDNDPANIEKIRIALDLMEYSITVAKNTRDALKSMRYHTYDLVVLNENFDTANPDVNGILIYLNRLVMAERRAIVLFLLTERYNTLDPMMAYNRSANIVVNLKDIDKIDTILQKGLNDSVIFHKIFKEALVKSGKM